MSHGCSLIATPHVVDEVLANLPDLGVSASTDWVKLRQDLILLDDVFTLDRPVVFSPAEDRPILFSALAWADVLLAPDRGDFGAMLGRAFCGLAVLKPGDYLQRERVAGRLGFDVPAVRT